MEGTKMVGGMPAGPVRADEFELLTFEELDPGRGAPSLRTARGQLNGSLADAAVRYLESGVLVAEVDEEPADIFDLDLGPDTDLSLMSDGRWVWPNMVTYYVREYRCSLDPRLVETAMRHGLVDQAKVDVGRAWDWLTRHSRRTRGGFVGRRPSASKTRL